MLSLFSLALQQQQQKQQAWASFTFPSSPPHLIIHFHTWSSILLINKGKLFSTKSTTALSRHSQTHTASHLWNDLQCYRSCPRATPSNRYRISSPYTWQQSTFCQEEISSPSIHWYRKLANRHTIHHGFSTPTDRDGLLQLYVQEIHNFPPVSMPFKHPTSWLFLLLDRPRH